MAALIPPSVLLLISSFSSAPSYHHLSPSGVASALSPFSALLPHAHLLTRCFVSASPTFTSHHQHGALHPSSSASAVLSTQASSAPFSSGAPPSPSLPSPSSSSSSPSSSSSSSASSAASRAIDPHNTEWQDVDLFKFTLWMSVFATVENGAFYPFYVLKTREQADRSTHYRALQSAKYHLRHLLRTQGVRGLYRGFVTSSVISLPAYGVYMGVYTWTKEQLGYRVSAAHSAASSSDPPAASLSLLTSVGAPFVAGIVADAASIALYVPGDVVVQRLQISNSPYRSFAHACTEIWKHEGMRGFFAGFGATFLTSGIASAIWWAVYENTKKSLYQAAAPPLSASATSSFSSANPHLALTHDALPASSASFSCVPYSASASASAPSPAAASTSAWRSAVASVTEVNRWPQLAAGFIAGSVTSTLINPLDVVKTRLQVQDTHRRVVITIDAATNKASKQSIKHAEAAAAGPSSSSSSSSASGGVSASSSGSAGSAVRYKNFWHGLQRVYVDEGLRGYFRGVVPKLISRGPLSAVSSLGYELVLSLSRKHPIAPHNHTLT